jgi:hypothetical protein
MERTPRVRLAIMRSIVARQRFAENRGNSRGLTQKTRRSFSENFSVIQRTAQAVENEGGTAGPLVLLQHVFVLGSDEGILFTHNSPRPSYLKRGNSKYGKKEDKSTLGIGV